MPGGIGPVSLETLVVCARQGRPLAAQGSDNEIFFHLDGRRVYYDARRGLLYFVSTPDDLVARTLQAVLRGTGLPLVIEQLHLDTHRLFHAARRLALSAEHAHTALVALRLAGVQTTVV